MISVILEQTEYRDAIYDLNCKAFPGVDEAKLVNRLREQADPYISLLAIERDQLIGYICLTPVTLESDPSLTLMGLAPMAVLPSHQKRGVGSRLVRTGIKACKEIDASGIVVLGHPQYYPRFGFKPASTYHLKSTYGVPDDVFMALELKPDALKNAAGTVHYHPCFEGL